MVVLGVFHQASVGARTKDSLSTISGGVTEELGVGCGSLRVHVHASQDEPGRARAAEEQKHTGLQLVVFVNVPQRFSQGPLHSP